MFNILKKKRAFTLVEVIIVLAIIAIIAAIAIPNLTKVRQDSKRKADIQTCETIYRTVTTLVVDEAIRYSTNTKTTTFRIIPGEYTVTTDGRSATVYPVQIAYTSEADETGIVGKTADEATAILAEYFNELKKPQQDDGYSYKVKIDFDGTIREVSAEKSTDDGTTISDLNNTVISKN